MDKLAHMALIGLAALLLGSTAEGKLLTWHLQDVKYGPNQFVSGSTATGFFTFDPANGTRPLTWDINGVIGESSSSGQGAFSSVGFSGGHTFMEFAGNNFTPDGNGSEKFFDFTFNGTLPENGGTVPLAGGSLEQCNVHGSCPFREDLLSGNVTTVPEPQPLMVFAVVGALVLVAAHRRAHMMGHA